MIGISKLYCGSVEVSDALRYRTREGPTPAHLLQFKKSPKPVVVWNTTRRCNLRCVHCYAESEDRGYSGELDTGEGEALLDDLASFGVPVILFSGGEPMLRPDLPRLIRHATGRGLRAVVSTNGTVIDRERAQVLRDAGVAYVGISLDGLGDVNDRFRRVPGAFRRALEGVAACMEAGVKVGLRFTITRHNARDVGGIFDLVEKEGIERACFYHLVYAGRGSRLVEEDLGREEARGVVDLILDRTRDLYRGGRTPEILTVDNHTDGPYLYLRMKAEGSPRTEDVYELLRMNGGNASGQGIGCVGPTGDVHPDQFWRHLVVGNVRERPFREIWGGPTHEMLARLRERKKYLHGRCGACRFLEICNGNFRVRAEALTGDVWAPDPACYLSDKEIGLGE
jgi:12,18-didecarboxysiroheme deacetylase